MRPTLWLGMIGLAVGLGGCALATSNTENLLQQAGFRKMTADTPKSAEHLETIAPNRIIKRTTGGKAYYVYADPSHCKCMWIGNESAYAKYKSLAQAQAAAYVEEQRQQEEVEGAK